MRFRDWLRACWEERDPAFDRGFDYALFVVSALCVAANFVLAAIGAISGR